MPAVQNSSGNDLIVVTGGAGFIGSNIGPSWRRPENASSCAIFFGRAKSGAISLGHGYIDIVRPMTCRSGWVATATKTAGIVHMAAISSMTEKDVDKFVKQIFALLLISGTRAPRTRSG